MITEEKMKRFLESVNRKENVGRESYMSDKMREIFIKMYLEGKVDMKDGKFVEGERTMTEEEKEIARDFEELLESDKVAFLRSAYMTGLYMHLEKLQWAIMKDTEWHGGKRAIAYIKIQNMMNTAHSMIAPEYEYLLEDALNEWTIERRKREEI